MWLSKESRFWRLRWLAAALMIVMSSLSACTLEPLNAARSDSTITNGIQAASPTVAEALANTEIDQVNTRVAQQVRNALLFSFGGGREVSDGQYRVELRVVATNRTLSVETSSQAPTSAQVEVGASYTIFRKSDNTKLAFGQRQSIAAYDRTPQSFANQRAERDAENRAAKEVAEQLRLAIAQAIASQ